MTAWARHVDIEDPDTRVALMRTPAALVISAFIVGLTAGELAKALAGRPFLAVDYWIAIAVCVPFLLASRRFQTRRIGPVLRGWLAIAAVVSTLRLVHHCAWAFANSSIALAIVVVAFDTAVAAALWLGVYGVLATSRTPSRA